MRKFFRLLSKLLLVIFVLLTVVSFLSPDPHFKNSKEIIFNEEVFLAIAVFFLLALIIVKKK